MGIPASHTGIPAAYDAALNAAILDPKTIRWVGANTIAVDINGETHHGTVHVHTQTGIRAALSEALGSYCAAQAVRQVAGLEAA